MNTRLWLIGIVLLMIGILIWVVLLTKHASPPLTSSRVAPLNKPESGASPSQENTSIEKVSGLSLDLWTRPPAKVAARHLRRTKFAALRRLGASEQLVDRLTDGDAFAVVTELKERAQRGDPSAANMLAHLVRSVCPLASPSVLQEAQSLPGQDAEWLNAAQQEKTAFNKQFWAACQSIDQKAVDAWVAKAAEQGNSASLWLLSFGGSPADFKQKIVEAVNAGYPEAQADLAEILTHPPPDLGPGGPDDGEKKLFEKAAVSLPFAQGALALCEFTGCPGIDIDIPAAVSHARDAAQRGAFEAMIEIGPQLQASMIDPTEVAAWNLVAGMLAQKGCSPGGFGAPWRTSAANTLTSNTISVKARSLAEQYWRDYGAQMMSNIGCRG